MSRLVFDLPEDRSHCGTVTLIDDAESVLCGPFPVAARSSSKLAAAHGNVTRDPLLPYGDCPKGRFVIRAIVSAGKNRPLPKAEFGSGSVLMLEGISGDAALADANGRFNFPVQGGALSRDGRLRSTAGGLRMRDRDLRTLVREVERTHSRYCEVIAGEAVGEMVADDDGCALADPLPLSLTRHASVEAAGGIHLPRKGTVLIAMSASFVAQSALHAAPIRQAVAPARIPAARDVHWVSVVAAAAAVEQGQAYNPPPSVTNRAPAVNGATPVVNSPTLQGLQSGGNTGQIFDNSTGNNASDVNFSTHTQIPAVSSGAVQGAPAAPPQAPPSQQASPAPQNSGDSAYQQYLQQQQQRDTAKKDYDTRANQVIHQLQQQGQAAPTPPPASTPAPPAPPPKKKSDTIDIVPAPDTPKQ